VDTYSFKYILPEAAKKKDKGKESNKKNKGDDGEAFKEAIRDTKISWLAKLPADSKEAKVITIKILKFSVAEPHHFYAAPAPGKNFDAAPAPAPTLLYSKAKFLK
jgi:hypothetical protein